MEVNLVSFQGMYDMALYLVSFQSMNTRALSFKTRPSAHSKEFMKSAWSPEVYTRGSIDCILYKGTEF